MEKHSISVSQTVYDQIRGMSRTAILLTVTHVNVGDRITFSTSDEGSAIDRYISHIEAVDAERALVCFVWQLRDATKALVQYCDTAESAEDSVKMVAILDMLRAQLK